MEFQDHGILGIQNFKNIEISELWNFKYPELYDQGIIFFKLTEI